VLEVDLGNAYDLTQDVINAAFDLRPRERLVFPAQCDVSQFDLRGLRGLDSLACIELLPNTDISNVPTSIRHLRVVSFEKGPEGFLTHKEESRLQHLASLRSLTICLDSSEVAVVGRLRSLEILNLQGSTLNGHDLAEIATLPRLRVLVLSSDVDDKAINSIANCRTLTELALCNTDVTAESLPKLMGMNKLETLEICNTSIRSQDFRKAWPALKQLHLDSTQLGNESEASFRKRMRGVDVFVQSR